MSRSATPSRKRLSRCRDASIFFSPRPSKSWMRSAAAEAVGTALLLAAVVGSGIMGERLAGGNTAIALLANSLATGFALIALIIAFMPRWRAASARHSPASGSQTCRRSWFPNWSEPGSQSWRTRPCGRTRSLWRCPLRMARTDFPREWQDWVAHNVQRGCSSTDIFNTLVREGFAPEVAERALNMRRVALKRFPSERIELYTAEGFLQPPECEELVEI